MCIGVLSTVSWLIEALIERPKSTDIGPCTARTAPIINQLLLWWAQSPVAYVLHRAMLHLLELRDLALHLHPAGRWLFFRGSRKHVVVVADGALSGAHQIGALQLEWRVPVGWQDSRVTHNAIVVVSFVARTRLRSCRECALVPLSEA